MKNEIWKRLISGLLAFSLMFGMMPPVYAAEAEQPEAAQTEVTEETTLATSAPTEPEESSAPAPEPEESFEATDPSTESAGNNSRALDENAGIATASTITYESAAAKGYDETVFHVKDGTATDTELKDHLSPYGVTASYNGSIWNLSNGVTQIILGGNTIYSNSTTSRTYENGISYTAKQQIYTKSNWISGSWGDSGNSLTFYARVYHDIAFQVVMPDGYSAQVFTLADVQNTYSLASGDVLSGVYEDDLAGGLTLTIPTIQFNDELNLPVIVTYGGTTLNANSNGTYTLNSTNVTSSATLLITYSLPEMQNITVKPNVEGYGTITLSVGGETLVPSDDQYLYALAKGTTVDVSTTGSIRGWYVTDESGTTSFVESVSQFTVTGNATYEALFYTASDPFVAKKKDTDFYYLQSQLKTAIEGASDDDTIVLIANATLSESVTIPDGVTFLLPYSLSDTSVSTNSDTLYANADWQGGNATFYGPGTNTTVILSVKNNSTITVNGQLILGGQIYSHTLGLAGYVGGKHSDIQMETGSKIVVNNVLSSCGYITGGEVEVSGSGKIYQPFVLGDFRGGTYCNAAYSIQDVTAFNMYTMMNVRSDITVEPGGSMNGYAYLYAGSQNNNSVVSMLARSNALIITGSSTRTYVTFDENKKTSGNGKSDAICHATVRFVGDVTFSSMSLKVTLAGSSATINTANVSFPVPYNYKLILGSGGTYTANSEFKIMPGGEVVVEPGATLVIPAEKTIVVYEGYNDVGYANSYYPSGAELSNIELSEAGKLIVNGTLKIEAKGIFAGKIQTQTQGAKVQIDSSAILESSYHEGVVKGDGAFNYVIVKSEGATNTNKVSGKMIAQLFDNSGNKWIKMEPGTTYYSFEGTSAHILDSTYPYTSYADDKTETETTGTYAVAPTLYGSWGIPSMVFYNGSVPAATYTAEDYETGSVEVPTAQREGYDFTGWYTKDDEDGTLVYGAEQAGTQVTMPCDNLTLYAHFAPKQYTVTFEENGGTDVRDISGLYGYTVTDFPTTTRAGYTFDGWYNNIEFSGEPCTSITMPINGTTLYAKWTAIEYNITWVVVEDDAYPVTGAPAAIDNPVTFDTSIALPTTNDSFFRTGYNLIGWSLSVDGAAKKGTVTLSELNNGEGLEAGEVLLYAIWEPVEYTVRLNPNGGELEDADWQNKDEDNWNVRSYTVESPITLPTAVKKGYALKWVSGETVLSPGDTISTPDQQGKYTANWTIKNYTVALYLAEDATEAWKTIGFTVESSDITLPEPEKTGYEFVGWLDQDGNEVETIKTGSTGDVKLTASWLAESYTIELDPGVGTLPDGWSDQTYTIESDDIILPVLSQNGYDFKGWIDTDGNVYDKILAGSYGNLKLKADWEIIPYTITLNTDGGSVNNWDNYTYYVNSGEIILPAEDLITKEGHTFVGWTDEEGNDARSIPTGSFGDRSFKAIWTINEYTVDFVTYCDAPVNPITAVYGEEISAPDAITREGYTFEGWYDNAAFDGEKFVFSTMPAKNVTLYAKWDAIKYEIQLLLNDGTLPEGVSETIPYTIESQVTLPVPSKYGYDFGGWYDNEELNGEEIQSGHMPIDGLNLYAKWEPKSISVTLNADGGSFSDGQTTMQTSVFFGKMYRTQGLQTPTRTGYRFDYWMLDGVEATDLSVNREEAHELVAHWTAKEYDVVFNAGDGLINDTQNSVTIRVAFNSVLGQLPTATREGYDFMGWYDGDQKITIDTVLKTEGAEYKALWAAQTYSITLDYGYDVPNGTAQVTFGKEYSEGITSPSRTGYAFDAWYLDEDCTEPLKLNDAVTLDYPGTLYAKWTALEFDITYHNVDGVTELRRGFNSAELPITLAHPEKTGYTFTGWTVDGEEGLILDYTIEIGTAQDLTLTANWGVNQYTLTFVTGSDSVIEPVMGDYGAAFTVALPEKTGYSFAGWNPELPATIPAQDTEYVAQWAPISYQVQYDLKGGQWNTGVNAPEGNVNYETQITLPEQQAR